MIVQPGIVAFILAMSGVKVEMDAMVEGWHFSMNGRRIHERGTDFTLLIWTEAEMTRAAVPVLGRSFLATQMNQNKHSLDSFVQPQARFRCNLLLL